MTADTPGAQLRPREELLAMLNRMTKAGAPFAPIQWLSVMSEAAERIRADAPPAPGPDDREAVLLKRMHEWFLTVPEAGTEAATTMLMHVAELERFAARRAQGSSGGEGALREALEGVLNWASRRCPCENDAPRICPLCDADVKAEKNDGRCRAVDATFPPRLLDTLRAALSAPPVSRGEAGLRRAEVELRSMARGYEAYACKVLNDAADRVSALATPGGGDESQGAAAGGSTDHD